MEGAGEGIIPSPTSLSEAGKMSAVPGNSSAELGSATPGSLLRSAIQPDRMKNSPIKSRWLRVSAENRRKFDRFDLNLC